jgi:hypothetical protein
LKTLIKTNFKQPKLEQYIPREKKAGIREHKSKEKSKKTAYVVLEIQDLREYSKAITLLHLKSPYPENFEKLSQAMLSINEVLVERLEVKGAD